MAEQAGAALPIRPHWRSATQCAPQENRLSPGCAPAGARCGGRRTCGCRSRRVNRHCCVASSSLAWSAMRARLSALPSTISTSKMPGDVVRPVSAARNGCATAPSLAPCARRRCAHGLFGRRRRPWLDRGRVRRRYRASSALRLRCQQGLRLVVQTESAGRRAKNVRRQ